MQSNTSRQFLVDVDKDKYKSEVDPISSHSRIAEYYKYRPPYTDNFFSLAAEKLKLKRDDVILDLLCGRGELGSRFSRFSDTIYGVDGSDDMLNCRIEKANISYFKRDVNQEPLNLPRKADHIVIGSAIHWVEQTALQEIINTSLNEGGHFCVTHTLFRRGDQPYSAKLSELNTRFGKDYERASNVDLWGREKMEACGYKQVDMIRLIAPVAFKIEFLFGNQLSYAYGDFHDNVMANFDQYRKEFFETVSPFVKDGVLSSELVNWGAIYAPQ